MASKASISNIALGRVGVSKRVSNIDTETTTEATTLKQFWDQSRDRVLKDFPWPFATKFVTLGLVATSPSEVDSEWKYSYRYPPDCVHIRRVPSGTRNDNRGSRIPFKIGQDLQGRLIYTDRENARLEYTLRVESTALFDVSFIEGLAWMLAYEIAPTLGGVAAAKWRADALKMFIFTIGQAEANAAGEEQPDEEPDGEFVLARG